MRQFHDDIALLKWFSFTNHPMQISWILLHNAMAAAVKKIYSKDMLNQFCYGEFPLLQIPQMKSFKQSI
jgi:hypothetical protein